MRIKFQLVETGLVRAAWRSDRTTFQLPACSWKIKEASNKLTGKAAWFVLIAQYY
jgi:hypothetical protein